MIIALMIVSASAMQIGGYGGPMVVGVMTSFDKLNAELDRYNTAYYHGSTGPQFQSPIFMIGGLGKAYIKNFSVGGWGGGFFNEAHGDSTTATLAFGMGFGEFGYHFDLGDIISLGPLVEIGGGGVAIEIKRARSGGFGPDPDTTDESYSAGKGFFNLGAGADITFFLPINDSRTSFVGLNIKGGYIAAVIGSDWYDNYGGATSVPEFSLSGPFFSLGVVFGGKTKINLGSIEEE